MSSWRARVGGLVVLMTLGAMSCILGAPGEGTCNLPAEDLAQAQIAASRPAAADPRLSNFKRLGAPMRASWRRQVFERGQSFAEYVASDANPLTASRRTLYLQPLGEFPERAVLEGDLPSATFVEGGLVSRVFSPRPADLRDFLAAFYGVPAALGPEISLKSLAPEPARVRNRHAQFRAREILSALRARVPADAYSVTALVARDIYVHEAQEYAFGYGLHTERVAVASVVQLDPQFMGQPRSEHFQRRIRERAYKLVAHEVGHTLGMEHCDVYACVMNGVAHVEELDATPLHLCPGCLSKVAYRRGVKREAEMDRRYGQLAAFYEAHELQGPGQFAFEQSVSARP